MRWLLATALIVGCARSSDTVGRPLHVLQSPRVFLPNTDELWATLSSNPERFVGDPIVDKLAALQSRGELTVLNCDSNARANLQTQRALCVEVVRGRERIRAWLQSRSRNESTVDHGSPGARTLVFAADSSGENRNGVWLSDTGEIQSRFEVQSLCTTIMPRPALLTGGSGWVTAATVGRFHSPIDLRFTSGRLVEQRGERRHVVTGPCVALSHGTLCLNRTADDPELVRYFAVGSDAGVAPALPLELSALLRTSEPRVLLRLRETHIGADILLGFPFAREAAGRALIVRLTPDVSAVQMIGDVDLSFVPPSLRRVCGGSAVAWPVRNDEDAFAISCGNLTAVIGSFVRPSDVIRSSLLLLNRVTAGRYRLIAPADCCGQSSDGSGVLYAHWCDPSPEVANDADLCISRIGAAGRVRELLRGAAPFVSRQAHDFRG